jgi:Arc-like DNA binding domain
MAADRPSLYVRLPDGLIERLRQRADEHGVSMNTLLVGLIAGSMGWRPDSKEEAMTTTEAGYRGWRTLTSTEVDSYLEHGGIRVSAKTARRGRDLVLHAESGGRHALLLLDPETLTLVSMTTGRTSQAAWEAMNSIRRQR